MRIVAWPPVGIVSAAPWVERPVVRSEGLLSGARAVASAGPARRVAQLSVSSLALGRSGAGYMAQLWRELDGGINLVRLDVVSTNWVLDRHAGYAAHGTAPMGWTTDGTTPMDWTTDGTTPMAWFTGPVRSGGSGTDAQGYPTISLTGLPPNTLIVRPDDVLRSFVLDGGDFVSAGTARAVTVATSDATGAVTIRLDAALPAGVISLHDAESVVFEVTGITPGAQGVGADWQYQVNLREVLAHERVGATEWNPW
ncbi:hypothetical protein [Gemmobacter nectariphilus]|uniref:hypothetical protein n=1 Tax=Gemmobacter nectariphilus TaxID=220343 RepID=UPI000414686F|nr:hypothetical protein [Gemmobacter nectariphilus]